MTKSTFPENHLYWYTREAAVEIIQRRGMRIVEFIKTVEHTDRYDENLDRWSEPLWPEVMPPGWLCREVLES